ncbi:hypothetical protein PoB_006345700 [Plakobranchus ocellatus]|uniref:Uncharacterized protein n=1 Tax=Plakobranchus ocellatus TaxID=259542 RepID=A0AAV4CYE2_9GAST|nr:hypothetical protein PoB_006345700 [Plakobranchus ocellatus]
MLPPGDQAEYDDILPPSVMAKWRDLMSPSRNIFAVYVVNNPGIGIGTHSSSPPKRCSKGEPNWPHANLEGVLDGRKSTSLTLGNDLATPYRLPVRRYRRPTQRGRTIMTGRRGEENSA